MAVHWNSWSTEPTRWGVILDLVLSRAQDLVRDAEVAAPVGSIDHNAMK